MNQFIVSPTDDYRLGQRLEILDQIEKDVEHYIIKLEVSEKWSVYYFKMLFGEFELFTLKTFSTQAEADYFAKEQYYYRNEDYPFIVDGMTWAYKSTGKRTRIECTSEPMLPDENDFYEDYLLVSNGIELQTHSLNSGAEW